MTWASLARSVIPKYGGKIEISSHPGKGTSVIFRIQIGHDHTLNLTPRPPTGRTCVLIMDDEEAIPDILRSWPTRPGYDPVITHDGAAAVQVHREAIKGLLTLDRAVRVIICSGYSTDPVMAS